MTNPLHDPSWQSWLHLAGWWILSLTIAGIFFGLLFGFKGWDVKKSKAPKDLLFAWKVIGTILIAIKLLYV